MHLCALLYKPSYILRIRAEYITALRNRPSTQVVTYFKRLFLTTFNFNLEYVDTSAYFKHQGKKLH